MPRAPRVRPSRTVPEFCGVHKGRKPGVYETWPETDAQAHGFSGGDQQVFRTYEQADAYFRNGPQPVSEASVSAAVEVPSLVNAADAVPTLNSDIDHAVITETSGTIVVFTDGACPDIGTPAAKAGIGVWWGWNDERNLSERCPGEQTNNRAELIAIIRALEAPQDQSVHPNNQDRF